MKNFSVKLLKESLFIGIASLFGAFTGIGIGKMLMGDVSPWYLVTPLICILLNAISEISTQIRFKIKYRRNSDE